jgi:hypothetical protein
MENGLIMAIKYSSLSGGGTPVDVKVAANIFPTRTSGYGRVTATVAVPAGTYIAYQNGLGSVQWTVNGVSVAAPTGQAAVVSFTTTGTTFSIDYSYSSHLSWKNVSTTWLVGSSTAIETDGTTYVVHNKITGSPWGFVNYINSSTDLISWTTRYNTGDTNNPGAVAYNPNVTGGYKWIANTERFIYASTNGTTWTQVFDANGSFGINNTTYGIGKGNGTYKYVLGTNSSRNVLVSTNGISWTTRTANSSFNNPNMITGGTNSKYLAPYYGGYYSYSTDGVTWSDASLPTYPFSHYWMGYANSTYIATTQVGTYSSTDGITWTIVDPTAKAIYDLRYISSKYWGLDNASNIVSSTDLITWNTEANITGLTSYTHDGAKFVAWTGANTGNSKFYISTNGSGWTSGASQVTLVPVTSTPVTAS